MRQTAIWPVAVRVVHNGEETKAELVLDTGQWFMDYSGSARQGSLGARVPEAADALAVGEALIELGSQLIGMAESEMAARQAKYAEQTARAGADQV